MKNPGANSGCTFINATIGARRSSLRMKSGLIDAPSVPPQPGDLVVDLRGDRMLPGLINAHDHLQLNNFPRLKYRERHENVAQWIADIDTQRATDPAIAESARVARDLRLRLGGVKNILSGVTTVAHHDPWYPVLGAGDFPCRVLPDYGWAHSLALEGEFKVQESYRGTPADRRWFIHAGEGVDAAARREFSTLERLDCIASNTLLIHGVAFTAAERERLAVRGAGLIWCPSSNFFLLGATAECADLIAQGRVALGSDSRLSGAGDLLDELAVAREHCGVTEADLTTMVTSAAAMLLGLPDRGALRAGALADCVILPRDLPLSAASRADLRCVMLGGVMRYGDEDLAQVLMAPERRVPVTVDGRPKIVERGIAEFLRTSPLQERGVLVMESRGKAA
jgi:cytosine/adenosine deaminase-related metal-dependent hydrolase